MTVLFGDEAPRCICEGWLLSSMGPNETWGYEKDCPSHGTSIRETGGEMSKVSIDQEVAAKALLQAIEVISEDEWCAGWMADIEFMLWRDIEEGRNDRHQLKALSEACGGWWAWQDRGKESKETFVPLEEWTGKYAAWKARQAEYSAENRRRCAAAGHPIDGLGPSIWGHCSCGDRPYVAATTQPPSSESGTS